MSEGLTAAREGVAFRDRGSWGFVSATGRDPSRMLAGIVTGHVPGPLVATASDAFVGRAEASAVLTPKGRMVAELRLLPMGLEGSQAAGHLLLDVGPAGLQGTLAHFRRYVPPRFASIEDATEAWGLLTALGPDAPDLLSRDVLGLRVEAGELRAGAEGDLVGLELGSDRPCWVVRSGAVSVPSWDVIAPADAIASWRTRWSASVPSLGPEEWTLLRVEAGRPEFGVDMDERTIPVEAGIQGRVIDYGKGCFTGQEVIVRIRDRGHVNRHLRGLEFPPDVRPAAGDELLNGDRVVGVVTTAVVHPGGKALGLGYVRREIEPGAQVRLGDAPQPCVRVWALDEAWPPDVIRDGASRPQRSDGRARDRSR